MLAATVLENPFLPDAYRLGLTARQAVFLADGRGEVLYGGAGGGGKSVALLIAAAQYVTQPGYAALILRRRFTQLAKAESILALAKSWWLARPDVHWHEQSRTFTFPSGAVVQFGHMDDLNARYDYQGAVYQYVGYDELTQFVEEMYTYLFTRLRRRADSPLPLRMRAASNPGGVGHTWVKARFVDPKSRRAGAGFVPAKLADNPNVDRASYEASLAGSDLITRQQILDGNWDAVEGGRFRAAWLRAWARDPQSPDMILLADDRGAYRFNLAAATLFATCDPASSAKTSADYTVISVWAVTPRGDLVWVDCLRRQVEIPDQPKLLEQVTARHALKAIGIEAVASNRSMLQFAQRMGLAAAPLTPKGQDKLSHAQGGLVHAENGQLWLPAPGVVDGFPLDDVRSELLRFTGTPEDDHDDIVDTLSYAVDMKPRFYRPDGLIQPVIGVVNSVGPTDRGGPKPVPRPVPRR